MSRVARALLALLPLVACQQPKAPPPPPSPAPAAVAELKPADPAALREALDGLKELKFGVVPFLAPEEISKRYTPLAGWLSMKLGIPVRVVVPASYDALGESLDRGEVDLGSLAPLSYVKAKAKFPRLRPILMTIAEGSATYSGYIIVKADSPFQSIADLKGKRFAYVEPQSTSGYLYARALLKEKGFDPDTLFGSTEFLGTHDRVIEAVYRGQVDAGATYSGAFSSLRSKGIHPLSLRIIAKTPRLPHDAYCVRPELPQVVADELVRLLGSLSTLSEEGREALALTVQLNGFMPFEDARYDGIRQVLKTLNDR